MILLILFSWGYIYEMKGPRFGFRGWEYFDIGGGGGGGTGEGGID